MSTSTLAFNHYKFHWCDFGSRWVPLPVTVIIYAHTISDHCP